MTTTEGFAASEHALSGLIGHESVSDWRVIDQETVNRYAEVSGDGEDEWRGHAALPVCVSASTHIEKPTAGIGSDAPSRVSRPS